jgi:hypothetical protein
VAGVMVLVLGVEFVGVRLELELERTEDEGEGTIAGSIDGGQPTVTRELGPASCLS